MVSANLCEISRSFLRESSRLRIFVRGVNAKKKLFSWADLYMRMKWYLRMNLEDSRNRFRRCNSHKHFIPVQCIHFQIFSYTIFFFQENLFGK